MTGKKRTAREPLWKCRKRRDDVKTAGESLSRDQAPTKPDYGRSGIRHERWLCQEDVETSCCTRDEGGPFGAALQEEASNCHKLLRSKGRGGERYG